MAQNPGWLLELEGARAEALALAVPPERLQGRKAMAATLGRCPGCALLQL